MYSDFLSLSRWRRLMKGTTYVLLLCCEVFEFEDFPSLQKIQDGRESSSDDDDDQWRLPSNDWWRIAPLSGSGALVNIRKRIGSAWEVALRSMRMLWSARRARTGGREKSHRLLSQRFTIATFHDRSISWSQSFTTAAFHDRSLSRSQRDMNLTLVQCWSEIARSVHELLSVQNAEVFLKYMSTNMKLRNYPARWRHCRQMFARLSKAWGVCNLLLSFLVISVIRCFFGRTICTSRSQKFLLKRSRLSLRRPSFLSRPLAAGR